MIEVLLIGLLWAAPVAPEVVDSDPTSDAMSALSIPKLSFSRPTTIGLLRTSRFGSLSLVGSSFGGNGCIGSTVGLGCGELSGVQVGLAFRPRGWNTMAFASMGWTTGYTTLATPDRPAPRGRQVVGREVLIGLRVDASRGSWKRPRFRIF